MRRVEIMIEQRRRKTDLRKRLSTLSLLRGVMVGPLPPLV
jgi:hypothetical protein